MAPHGLHLDIVGGRSGLSVATGVSVKRIFLKLMYIIQGIGNNYIVKLNNKLLNLPHLKDLYKIEVFNFMFKFILLIKKYNSI